MAVAAHPPEFDRSSSCSSVKRVRDAPQSPLQNCFIGEQQMRHFQLADYRQSSVELTAELDLNNLKVDEESPCDEEFWGKVNDVIDECLADDDEASVISTDVAATEVAPDTSQPNLMPQQQISMEALILQQRYFDQRKLMQWSTAHFMANSFDPQQFDRTQSLPSFVPSMQSMAKESDAKAATLHRLPRAECGQHHHPIKKARSMVLGQ